MGFQDTPGEALEVTTVGHYALVSDGEIGGLRVIDIADPANPEEIGFYLTPASTTGIAGNGNYAYLASGNSGLFILRLSQDTVVGAIPLEGGSLYSTNGDTNLAFASDTFSETVTLTYRRLLFDQNVGAQRGIGHTIDVTAVYSDTGQPALPVQPYTLTIQYQDIEVGSAIEDTLALYYWDGAKWEREPTSRLDTSLNSVQANPTRFSMWAVLGETHRLFLPGMLRGESYYVP